MAIKTTSFLPEVGKFKLQIIILSLEQNPVIFIASLHGPFYFGYWLNIKGVEV